MWEIVHPNPNRFFIQGLQIYMKWHEDNLTEAELETKCGKVPIIFMSHSY